MGTDIKNDMSQRTLESINATSENAHQVMEEKKAQYDAAMKKYSIFQGKLSDAKYRMNSAKGSDFTRAKSNYATIFKQSWNSECDADILRDSLQSSISYCRKMDLSAFLANSILG